MKAGMWITWVFRVKVIKIRATGKTASFSFSSPSFYWQLVWCRNCKRILPQLHGASVAMYDWRCCSGINSSNSLISTVLFLFINFLFNGPESKKVFLDLHSTASKNSDCFSLRLNYDCNIMFIEVWYGSPYITYSATGILSGYLARITF